MYTFDIRELFLERPQQYEDKDLFEALTTAENILQDNKSVLEYDEYAREFLGLDGATENPVEFLEFVNECRRVIVNPYDKYVGFDLLESFAYWAVERDVQLQYIQPKSHQR